MKRSEGHQTNSLYRSRKGLIFGVCRGAAEYFDFSPFWIRTVAVVALVLTGLWPVTGLYVLAAIIMKPEPVIPVTGDDEQEFYDSYTGNRHRAVQRLKKRFDRLERRIQNMEHVVTGPEYDWDNRMKG